MTNVAIETLWLRLHDVLLAFAEKLCTVDPTLVRRLERTKNDTFLLRVYLSLSKQTQGDEVAICVDVRRVDQELIVESDACMDDGTIIATGPCAALSGNESDWNTAICDWLDEFERFLKENETAVSKAAAQLA